MRVELCQKSGFSWSLAGKKITSDTTSNGLSDINKYENNTVLYVYAFILSVVSPQEYTLPID